MEFLRLHVGVAEESVATGNPLQLDFSRPNDPAASPLRRFTEGLAHEVFVFECRHFNMKIDPIQERARYLRHIFLYLELSAGALTRRIGGIAARARIHRAHEHEACRELHRRLGSTDGDAAVLERLP